MPEHRPVPDTVPDTSIASGDAPKPRRERMETSWLAKWRNTIIAAIGAGILHLGLGIAVEKADENQRQKIETMLRSYSVDKKIGLIQISSTNDSGSFKEKIRVALGDYNDPDQIDQEKLAKIDLGILMLRRLEAEHVIGPEEVRELMGILEQKREGYQKMTETQDILKVLHEMVQEHKTYDLGKTGLPNILRTGTGECKAIAAFLLSVIPPAYPDLELKLQNFTGNNGVRHVRVVANIGGVWFALEKPTPTPIELKPGSVLLDPSDLALVLIDEPIESESVKGKSNDTVKNDPQKQAIIEPKLAEQQASRMDALTALIEKAPPPTATYQDGFVSAEDIIRDQPAESFESAQQKIIENKPETASLIRKAKEAYYKQLGIENPTKKRVLRISNDGKVEYTADDDPRSLANEAFFLTMPIIKNEKKAEKIKAIIDEMLTNASEKHYLTWLLAMPWPEDIKKIITEAKERLEHSVDSNTSDIIKGIKDSKSISIREINDLSSRIQDISTIAEEMKKNGIKLDDLTLVIVIGRVEPTEESLKLIRGLSSNGELSELEFHGKIGVKKFFGTNKILSALYDAGVRKITSLSGVFNTNAKESEEILNELARFKIDTIIIRSGKGMAETVRPINPDVISKIELKKIKIDTTTSTHVLREGMPFSRSLQDITEIIFYNLQKTKEKYIKNFSGVISIETEDPYSIAVFERITSGPDKSQFPYKKVNFILGLPKIQSYFDGQVTKYPSPEELREIKKSYFEELERMVETSKRIARSEIKIELGGFLGLNDKKIEDVFDDKEIERIKSLGIKFTKDGEDIGNDEPYEGGTRMR